MLMEEGVNLFMTAAALRNIKSSYRNKKSIEKKIVGRKKVILKTVPIAY